jgi:hypothetical protein
MLVFWFLFPPPVQGIANEADFEFNLSNGYHHGRLLWNIAGDLDGENPNILSELTWSELQIYHLQAQGEIATDAFALRALLGYGWILAGDNQDSDYNSDDRTDEFSRSYSDGKGGYLLNGSVAIGPRYELKALPMTVIPLFGLAYHRQAMVMTDGVLVISKPPSTQPLGPIDGLNSSYTTNWISLILGVDVEYRITRWLSLAAVLSVFPSAYLAQADWNLRTDYAHPVSFVHRTAGIGFQGELSVGLMINRHWLLEPGVGIDYWFGGSGIDETFRAAGGSVATRLNEVIWKSVRFSLVTTFRL